MSPNTWTHCRSPSCPPRPVLIKYTADGESRCAPSHARKKSSSPPNHILKDVALRSYGPDGGTRANSRRCVCFFYVRAPLLSFRDQRCVPWLTACHAKELRLVTFVIMTAGLRPIRRPSVNLRLSYNLNMGQDLFKKKITQSRCSNHLRLSPSKSRSLRATRVRC